MALIRKINTGARQDENSGYGTNNSMYGGRMINRDGRPNIHKTGLGFFERLSWNHTLIDLSRWKFLGFILANFLLLNLVFAFIYFMVGVENLSGVGARNPSQKFFKVFFFLRQTFTTLAIGSINPHGILP